MPFQRGQLVPAERQDVGAQAHRRAGRVDVRARGRCTPSGCRSGPCPTGCARGMPRSSATATYSASRVAAVALMVIEVDTLSSGRPSSSRRMSLEGGDGHPGAPHLALGQRVIRVAPHLGGQIEGHRQAGLPGGQQPLEAGVGGLGRAEAGVLAHGPQPAPVHGGLHAAGEGELAGKPEIPLVGSKGGRGLLQAAGVVQIGQRDPRGQLAWRRAGPGWISAPGPGSAGASARARGLPRWAWPAGPVAWVAAGSWDRRRARYYHRAVSRRLQNMTVVTFTTDFGTVDGYVGAMKGVVLSLAPEAVLVDITHDVPRHDIAAGAFALAQAAPLYPPGTVHVAVVDPGGGRRPGRHRGRGRRAPISSGPTTACWPWRRGGRAWRTGSTGRSFAASTVSPTFHGRDVFAQTAGQLARGALLRDAGPLVDGDRGTARRAAGRPAGRTRRRWCTSTPSAT